MKSRLEPCVRGCGAKTLHDDGVCHGCRGRYEKNGEEYREGISDRLFEINDSGRGGRQGNLRLSRGFAMMRGVTV
jgi:hypothetical protein